MTGRAKQPGEDSAAINPRQQEQQMQDGEMPPGTNFGNIDPVEGEDPPGGNEVGGA